MDERGPIKSLGATQMYLEPAGCLILLRRFGSTPNNLGFPNNFANSGFYPTARGGNFPRLGEAAQRVGSLSPSLSGPAASLLARR